MDDFGNHLLFDYVPATGNGGVEFNWTAFVYYMRPDMVNIQWS